MKISVTKLSESGQMVEFSGALSLALKVSPKVSIAMAIQDLQDWFAGFTKAVRSKEMEAAKANGGRPTKTGFTFIAEGGDPKDPKAIEDAQARIVAFTEALKPVHDEEVDVPGDFPITMTLPEKDLLEIAKARANRVLAGFVSFEEKKG